MKKLFLDNFWLKIVAIISMTISHVGSFLLYFGYVPYDSNTYFILQIIGKIAFPIFVFLLIEGLNHTHSRKNYLTRLLIGAGIVYVGILVLNLPAVSKVFEVGGISRIGNIFLELFLLALTYCLLTSEDKKKRYYVILPVLYIVGMSVVKYLSAANVITYNKLHYLYDGLYLQFDLIGLLILFGYYFAYKINDKLIIKALNDDELARTYMTSPEYQFRKNGAAAIAVALVSVLCYLITYIPDPNMIFYCDFAQLSYVVLADLFILFYNGKLGFKNKYIQGAFYLYYPLHLAIIFLIFYFI